MLLRLIMEMLSHIVYKKGNIFNYISQKYWDLFFTVLLSFDVNVSVIVSQEFMLCESYCTFSAVHVLDNLGVDCQKGENPDFQGMFVCHLY